MTEYLYRVVSKTRDERWPDYLDPAENKWRVYTSSANKSRPYTSVSVARSIVTRENNYQRNSNGHLVYKVQRMLITDWEDDPGGKQSSKA